MRILERVRKKYFTHVVSDDFSSQNGCSQYTPLLTRRKSARYGDKMLIGTVPVAYIKSGKREDFLTVEEFVEDLYGKKVDHIVFKE